jgi:hypothetical protein
MVSGPAPVGSERGIWGKGSFGWVRRRAARRLGRAGPRVVPGSRPSNKSLVLTAQAGFNGDGCLIGAGLVSEVGVKLREYWWWGGVS